MATKPRLLYHVFHNEISAQFLSVKDTELCLSDHLMLEVEGHGSDACKSNRIMVYVYAESDTMNKPQ